ncbi:MAG: hypothetical protein PHN69_02080 [Candidatus Pacebacteria bacterium]|nr:hypothetical protein [Candidatus Paceibacterota bacterium]
MKKKGFIKTIIIIVIALIVLGYFGFDVENIIKSDKVQKNLGYVWNIVSKIWNSYLAAPVLFVWDKFFIGVIWNTIVSVLN